MCTSVIDVYLQLIVCNVSKKISWQRKRLEIFTSSHLVSPFVCIWANDHHSQNIPLLKHSFPLWKWTRERKRSFAARWHVRCIHKLSWAHCNALFSGIHRAQHVVLLVKSNGCCCTYIKSHVGCSVDIVAAEHMMKIQLHLLYHACSKWSFFLMLNAFLSLIISLLTPECMSVYHHPRKWTCYCCRWDMFFIHETGDPCVVVHKQAIQTLTCSRVWEHE